MTLEELRARVYDRLDEDPDDPQRWPASTVLEYLNDGIQVLSSRAGLNVATTTITQKPETLYYNLPADCIAVLAIYDDQDDALALTSWREFDRTQIPGGKLPEAIGRLKARWVRGAGTRATHAYTYGLKELVLWPMIGPATITDHVFLSDELEGDDATVAVALSTSATSGVGVWWNGTRLVEVASAPAVGEFSVDGETVTLGVAPSTGDLVQTSASSLPELIVGEVPTGDLDSSNTVFTIAGTPSDEMNVAVYLNDTRLINISDIYNEDDDDPPLLVGATGTFYMSGSTLTLTGGPIPDSGDHLVVDYTTDSDDVILGEIPAGDLDGENKDFTLAQMPADFHDVAVYTFGGVRLKRATGQPGIGEYMIAGKQIRLGRAPEALEGLFVDYVRVPEAADKEYTLHYLVDVENDLILDTDEPDLPDTFHETLVDYAVARCLLPKARGARIKRAMDMLSAFTGRVEQARYHNRNVALDNAVDSYGATP